MEMEGRWADLDYLLTRQGNVVGPDFEPGPELREFLHSDCRSASGPPSLGLLGPVLYSLHALPAEYRGLVAAG